jgi:hypothetical protein
MHEKMFTIFSHQGNASKINLRFLYSSQNGYHQENKDQQMLARMLFNLMQSHISVLTLTSTYCSPIQKVIAYA